MEWVTKVATTVHLMSVEEVMYEMPEQMIIIMMDLCTQNHSDAADTVWHTRVKLATPRFAQKHWEENETYCRVCMQLRVCVMGCEIRFQC